MVRNRKYSVHRANFIGLARSRFLCGGGVTRWGQAWGPRDRNETNLAKTSTHDSSKWGRFQIHVYSNEHGQR